jgi:hypothetical protein
MESIVLHEFEAWIYSDPQRCQWTLPQEGIVQELVEIRDRSEGPKLIDEGPETAPSKQLVRVWPGYQKCLHGPMAVGTIGLDLVRSRCPHADQWIRALEEL